ncbi:MAG: hypothetical protein ACYC1Q_05320 [Bacteroidia bacterium]
MLTILFFGSLGFGIITLSSCDGPEGPPIPVHIAVDQETRDFMYFKTGSYWIYESNDGLFDTVTVTSYWIDTLRFVDQDKNLISTSEYFSFTYYSSYFKLEYTIFRMQVMPTGSHINVDLRTDGGHWSILNTPNEKGVKYVGVNNYDFFTITDKRDTVINAVTRKLWSIDYNYWSIYEDMPVKVEMVSGVGITKKVTTFENRTWTLIDSYVFL